MYVLIEKKKKQQTMLKINSRSTDFVNHTGVSVRVSVFGGVGSGQFGGSRRALPPFPPRAPAMPSAPALSPRPARDALRQLRAVRGAGLRRQPLPARHLPGGRRQRHGPSPAWGGRGRAGAASQTEGLRGSSERLVRPQGPEELSWRAFPLRAAHGA